jgi:hypothetical protein
MIKELQFINHACYLYESTDYIILCDPWVEGLAFNRGWSLLDQSTSNDKLLEKILKNKKKLYIWYCTNIQIILQYHS